MTPDESTKHAVSSIRHNTAVLGMRLIFRFGIMGISTGTQCQPFLVQE